MSKFDIQNRKGDHGWSSNMTSGPGSVQVEGFVSTPLRQPDPAQFALVRLDRKWDGKESKSVAALHTYVSGTAWLLPFLTAREEWRQEAHVRAHTRVCCPQAS
jgi:hypothetical protein